MTATTPEKKTAPAAGTAEATSPQKGTEMRDSTVAPSAVKSEIARLLSELDNLELGQILTLDESDILYTAPMDEWWRPASEVNFSDLNSIVDAPEVFADFFDHEGNRISLSDRPEGWLYALEDGDARGGNYWYLPNYVHRLGGEGIIIGRGHWVAAETEQRDGELWVRFITREAARDRVLAQKREFLPVAIAAAPFWVDPAQVEVCEFDTGSRMLEVRYESRDFAPANNPIKALLKISSYVHMTMAGVPVTVEAPQMDVYVTESYNAANVTANDVRALAEGMNALAAEFDRITAAEATA